MRKLVLALAVAFCSFQSWSQSDCGELLDHDQDGIIGVADLMNLLSLFGQPLAVTAEPCDNLEFVTFDGYDYDLVEIGDQCWFAENLRTEHYANGDSISADLTDSEWGATTNGAVAVYGEDEGCEDLSPNGDACDPAWSLNQYGRLYNWYAVDDDRGLCPTGWHVPTDGEWMTLEMELGMTTEQVNGTGYRGTDQDMKLKANSGWYSGDNGSNSSQFTGLPGGYRRFNGNFTDAGNIGIWWTSTPSEYDGYSWNRILGSGYVGVNRNWNGKYYGFSVRCLKDSTP